MDGFELHAPLHPFSRVNQPTTKASHCASKLLQLREGVFVRLPRSSLQLKSTSYSVTPLPKEADS